MLFYLMLSDQKQYSIKNSILLMRVMIRISLPLDRCSKLLQGCLHELLTNELIRGHEAAHNDRGGPLGWGQPNDLLS